MTNPQIMLPHFAIEMGLTPEDVISMMGEVCADRRALHFLNRDGSGRLVGREHMLGPRCFRFTGTPAVFAAPRSQQRPRLVVASGPIEALCLAAVEGHRPDTVYAAVPGRVVAAASSAVPALIAQTGATIVSLSFSQSAHGLALSDAVWSLVHPRFLDTVAVDDFPPPEGRWSTALRMIRAAQGVA